MQFNVSMVPAGIVTFEQLMVWGGLIMASASEQTNKYYVNDAGILESIASYVAWPIRPPSAQNMVAQQIPYFIYRNAIALQPGYELMSGKMYEHAQEAVTDAEFQLPSSWMS